MLPDIVVTATRVAGVARPTGSAISVVNGARSLRPIRRRSSMRCARVPGLDITESGGPGATTTVRMRGANTGQTLVLIDGVRVNDPANASGDFDFVHVRDRRDRAHRGAARTAERALWIGCDRRRHQHHHAQGRRSGALQRAHRRRKLRHAVEHGAVSVERSVVLRGDRCPQESDGFSRYGYRIPAIEARFPNLEPDGFKRLAGSARVGFDAGEGFRFDAGALSPFTRSDFDAATGAFPDTPVVPTQMVQPGQCARRRRYLRTAPHAQPQRLCQPKRPLVRRVTFRINMLPATRRGSSRFHWRSARQRIPGHPSHGRVRVADVRREGPSTRRPHLLTGAAAACRGEDVDAFRDAGHAVRFRALAVADRRTPQSLRSAVVWTTLLMSPDSRHGGRPPPI